MLTPPLPVHIDTLTTLATNNHTAPQDKIIYLASSYAEVAAKVPPLGSKRSKYWGLSEVMRSRPLHMVAKMGRTLAALIELLEDAEGGTGKGAAVAKAAMARAPLYLLGMSLHQLQRLARLRDKVLHGRKSSGLIFQNDADELPGRAALTHLKHCALRNEDTRSPVFLPATMYRTNAHWLSQV